MGMADASKRINLAAPLISARRHGGAGAESTALPSYKPGETSGPMGHTGAVPFRWEHRPGHPKSVRTRRPPPTPPTTTVAKEATSPTWKPTTAMEREEDEQCSDASCVTVNCSAADLSDAAAAPGSRGSAMMDRFLPAAHAVAVASPLSTFRKAGRSVKEPVRPPAAPTGAGDRLPSIQRPLALQDVPSNYLQLLPAQGKNMEEVDDSESDVHSTHGFASRRCGLLPTRCVKSTMLLLNPASAMRSSRGARRWEGRSIVPDGGGNRREMNPLLRRSRKEQQHQPQHTGGHDPGMLHIRSLLRSTGGGLTGPAAAVTSELNRTVRELYRHRKGEIVQPKASHLGLLLVLDRSNEKPNGSSAARNTADAGKTSLTLPRAKSSLNAGKKLGWRDDAGGYGFPLLLEDKPAASPGCKIVLSPRAMLPLPLPKSPSESWLLRTLPSVSSRSPPATSFLGLHVPSRRQGPLPWCAIDQANVVDHAGQRQIRVHDLHK